jgi:hypothetical protein
MKTGYRMKTTSRRDYLQRIYPRYRDARGYARDDSQRALQAINDLYGNELHRFRNLFLPSVKLVRKVRVGSRTRRIYGKPQAPFERVCASPASDPARIAALKRQQQELDPFALSRAIQTKLEHIFSAQPRAGRARETPNSNFSEWQ